MAIFRFAATFILSFLLLSPFINSTKNEEVKPALIVLQDISSSMLSAGVDSLALQKIADKVDKQLASKFTIEHINFANGLESDNQFSLKQTNIAKAIDDIYDLKFNQNVGAILVISDGIYNAGNAPMYNAYDNTTPIYSLAFGDTTTKPDLIIGQVYYNNLVFLKDNFVVRFDLTAKLLAGQQASLNISEIKSNTTTRLQSKNVLIDEAYFNQTMDFELSATTPGVHHYRIEAVPLKNEYTKENNTTDFFVEVIDNRKKILVWAACPHPDVTAIKQALSNNINYQIEVKFVSGETPNLKNYDLVIYHQLPESESQLKLIETSQGSAVFILGELSSLSLLNKVQNIVETGSSTYRLNEVTAIVNNAFTAYDLDDAAKQNIQSMPPLMSAFGNYKSATGEVLLYQKIGSLTTDYPLIAFADMSEGRSCFIAGTGLWRWKLYDYMQHENNDFFNDFISQLIQYCSVQKDKRKLRVTPVKNVFTENETVIFHAQLYNDNYEANNEAELNLKCMDESGEVVSQNIFSRKGQFYYLDMGRLKPGDYHFESGTTWNGQNYQAKGMFSVAAISLESISNQANHQALRQMSERSKGKMYYPNQLDALIENLKKTDQANSIIYTHEQTEPMINLKWIFALVLLLISAEWFFRKYVGAY